MKAELAWRPCQQEFNLIGLSEYAVLDKYLNVAREPIITQIDFFNVKKKKKKTRGDSIKTYKL